MKRITSTLLLGAMLVFAASPAFGQVIFDMQTSTGNDTLFVGIPGSIIFNVDANGNNVAALTYPFQLVFSAGNVIGPLAYPGNAVPSAEADSRFENKAWNATYGQGTDPDTLLFGFVDFGGSLWNISGEVWRINVTATGEGTVRFDSVKLPPANELSAVDDQAQTLPITWLADGKEIAFKIRPNVPPVCDGAAADRSQFVFGELVTGTISGHDEDDGPAALSYQVISATNSNGTGPNNPFVTNADGTWQWQTEGPSVNENDVGTWTVVFGVYDGADLDTCAPVTFKVIAEKPLIAFRFGGPECLEAFSGSDICIPLYVDNPFPCDATGELGGFDLLFTYDNSLLTFTGLDVEGSVLVSSGWEYLTYRVVSTNPAKIRIVAIADMNNSNVHPDEYCIDGLIANVCFRTTNDRNLACQSAWLMFTWDDCGDNTASSRDGNELYMVADPANGPWIGGNSSVEPTIPGGGIINHSCNIESQLFRGEGGVSGPADYPCANPDPRKPNPIEKLYFVNGKIKIKCPGDIDDRGDMNLNGLAYEIADAVLYSNYFIFGPAVFMPGVQGEAQVAASDINADGYPLTVADLVYLIRVITGDADPIAGDLLGGGPKVAAVVGKLNVEALAQGANVTVRASSDLDMGAGLFVFNYTGTEIADVSLSGRASGMDVSFEANEGELRVLVYNIEDRAKIAAGSGEILQVSTTGGGSVELVSVEAASFMGGSLESNVSAKVLPTAFALKQNYPNPFNPATSMAIDFPVASEYTLAIYNIAGQVVKSYEGSTEAGTLTITWDGTDARGAKVASGVYFYSVEAADFHAVKKMVLMK